MSITKKDEEDFEKGLQEWKKAASEKKKKHFPKSARIRGKNERKNMEKR